jgi:hypothetical protein
MFSYDKCMVGLDWEICACDEIYDTGWFLFELYIFIFLACLINLLQNIGLVYVLFFFLAKSMTLVYVLSFTKSV